MYDKIKLQQIYKSMIEYFAGDPKRIQHFIKVHSLAKLIGEMEEFPDEQLYILEAAAYVHDIGIKVAEERYGKGNCGGKLQEELGPEPASILLKKYNFDAEQIARIAHLVGHHHTYTNIDGLDYQILVEADFLVNLYEDECSIDAIKSAYKNIFKTNTGKKLCQIMFGIEE